MDERYTAVVFSSQRRTGPGTERDGYDEMAARMVELASRQPGYRGIESVRGADGRGITVAYFDSDEHARGWKQHPEHLEAQRLGRERWYESYELRIATVERQYGWSRASRLVHIALPGDWASAQRSGVYTTSTRGISLEQEGFIHCSFEHQVESTANAYYGDLDRLVLLSIDRARLVAEVVVEPPFPGADTVFPHVYGPIPVDAVFETRQWTRTCEGAWSLPEHW
jgi:glutathione S-transferase